jgi:hypothetical protein
MIVEVALDLQLRWIGIRLFLLFSGKNGKNVFAYTFGKIRFP